MEGMRMLKVRRERKEKGAIATIISRKKGSIDSNGYHVKGIRRVAHRPYLYIDSPSLNVTTCTVSAERVTTSKE